VVPDVVVLDIPVVFVDVKGIVFANIDIAVVADAAVVPGASTITTLRS